MHPLLQENFEKSSTQVLYTEVWINSVKFKVLVQTSEIEAVVNDTLIISTEIDIKSEHGVYFHIQSYTGR